MVAGEEVAAAVMVVRTAEEITVGGSIAQGVPQQVRLLRPLREERELVG